MALALLLVCTGASAIKVGPGSPFAPHSGTPQVTPQRGPEPTPQRTVWQHPTLELLVTVSALREAARQSSFAVARPAALARVLSGLRQAPTLGNAAAQQALEDLTATLGSGAQQKVNDARANLERRAALQLASSRIARNDDLPLAQSGLAFYRLSFQVPGGQATVRAVEEGTDFNPFYQGMPASVLRFLETRLGR